MLNIFRVDSVLTESKGNPQGGAGIFVFHFWYRDQIPNWGIPIDPLQIFQTI